MMLQGTTQIKEKQEENVEEWIGLDFSSAQRAIGNGRSLLSKLAVMPLQSWLFCDALDRLLQNLYCIVLKAGIGLSDNTSNTWYLNIRGDLK